MLCCCRLELVLYEQACEYYRSEAKKVKAHKHKVSQSSQPALYVRHHFKVAFYNEMIADYTAALKCALPRSALLCSALLCSALLCSALL